MSQIKRIRGGRLLADFATSSAFLEYRVATLTRSIYSAANDATNLIERSTQIVEHFDLEQFARQPER